MVWCVVTVWLEVEVCEWCVVLSVVPCVSEVEVEVAVCGCVVGGLWVTVDSLFVSVDVAFSLLGS